MATSGLLTINTDGASRGNPGAAAYGYVIKRDGQLLVEEAGCLGEMTNNQAEYTALVRALEHALELGPDDRVVVHSDSELMVKQLNGEYRVKNEDLRPLYEEALDLSERFTGGVRFVHVRREKNRRADELCNEALDGKRCGMQPARLRLSDPQESPSRKRQTELPTPAGLHEEALACLKAAGVAAPESVWRQLLLLIQKQLHYP